MLPRDGRLKKEFVIGRKLRKVGSVSTNTTAEHWQEDNI